MATFIPTSEGVIILVPKFKAGSSWGSSAHITDANTGRTVASLFRGPDARTFEFLEFTRQLVLGLDQPIDSTFTTDNLKSLDSVDCAVHPQIAKIFANYFVCNKAHEIDPSIALGPGSSPPRFFAKIVVPYLQDRPRIEPAISFAAREYFKWWHSQPKIAATQWYLNKLMLQLTL